MVARGEVVWLELEQEGRRPVVVLIRHEALPQLRTVVVALVTRTIRGIETEVELEPEDGMPVECAVSLEEAPEAYKDVEQVVEIVERAGLAARVARLRPIGVLKG